MRKRIYPDAPTVAFAVRIQQKYAAKVKVLADRLGMSEVEVKRLVVAEGLEALGTV